MNNIGAGCKAMVINSDAGNNGKIVTVIRNIGYLDGFGRYHGTRWKLDCYLNAVNFFNEPLPEKYNHIGENQLKRIDDQEKGDWSDCEWQPKDLMVS